MLAIEQLDPFTRRMLIRQYEDVYQLTFPNEQVAATVTNRLNTFITGMANPSTLAGQSHTQTSYQGFQPATQLSTNAQSTPQYANIPLASSYRPPVLASQAAQPESQIPPHRSPSPSPAEEHNDAIQSQGFLETQYTPEEEATQITTNPPRKHPSSDMNVSDTTNPVSNSGHIDKKRKLDSDDTSDAHKSSNEGTDLATQPTKLVSDLIDLSECQNESNDSLGITHPPLDPYEGTPWGPLSRFSVSDSLSVLVAGLTFSEHSERLIRWQWRCTSRHAESIHYCWSVRNERI